MNTKYAIQKLTDKNFLVWSTQVQLVLEAKDLWKYVEDSYTPATSEAGKAKQRQERRQCLAEIVLNIDTKYVAAVMRKNSPKDAWNTLQEMHKSKCKASQLTLRKRLFGLEMDEDQTIRGFVESIHEIENELHMGGYEVSDSDKKLALLGGLLDEYEMVKTVLQGEENLSFEGMVARLEARQDEINRSDGKKGGAGSRHRSKGSAFVAHDSRKKGNKSCHLCTKQGHFVKDCFYNPQSKNYKPGLKPPEKVKTKLEQWKNRKSAEGGGSGDSASRASFAFMTSRKSSNDSMRNKWFLDSCASRHMTNQRDILHNFVDGQDDTVQTASEDTEMAIVGYGSVRLEQVVDGRRQIIELKDVAYMPGIRTNLVSLPLGQAAGITFEFPGGSNEMRARVGSETLMVGSRKTHTITELVGMTATRRKDISYSFFNAGSDDGEALMHKRTCHTAVDTLRRMIKSNAAEGLEVLASKKGGEHVCQECCAGKAKADTHKPHDKTVSTILMLR